MIELTSTITRPYRFALTCESTTNELRGRPESRPLGSLMPPAAPIRIYKP